VTWYSTRRFLLDDETGKAILVKSLERVFATTAAGELPFFLLRLCANDVFMQKKLVGFLEYSRVR
jgi:hypothetical protein